MSLFGFILFETIWASRMFFLPQFRGDFGHCLFKYIFCLFLYLFYFWDPCNTNAILSDVAPQAPEAILNFFNSFFFFQLLCLGQLQYLVFQITDSFLCFQSDVEPLQIIFVCLFQFCYFTFSALLLQFGTFLYFLSLLEVLTVFIHSSSGVQ